MAAVHGVLVRELRPEIPFRQAAIHELSDVVGHLGGGPCRVCAEILVLVAGADSSRGGQAGRSALLRRPDAAKARRPSPAICSARAAGRRRSPGPPPFGDLLVHGGGGPDPRLRPGRRPPDVPGVALLRRLLSREAGGAATSPGWRPAPSRRFSGRVDSGDRPAPPGRRRRWCPGRRTLPTYPPCRRSWRYGTGEGRRPDEEPAAGPEFAILDASPSPGSSPAAPWIPTSAGSRTTSVRNHSVAEPKRLARGFRGRPLEGSMMPSDAVGWNRGLPPEAIDAG